MKLNIYSNEMRSCCIFFNLLLICSQPVFSQSPSWLWAKALGGTNNDYGNSISIDASGNLLTTGIFSGTADFDPGPGVFTLSSAGLNDLFVTKTDGNGNFMWAKRIGSINNEFCGSVTTDPSGNIIFTGYYNGTIDFDPGSGTANLTASGYADVFVCKLDNTGNFVWAKSLGGPDNDDFGNSIVTDASGDIYLTGIFSGSADFDPATPAIYYLTSSGGPDSFISKLSSTGSFMWAKAIGGPDFDNGFSIAIDASNNVYATGYFTGSVDFNPGPQTAMLTSAGFFDAYVLKLNATGDFQWAKRMGGSDDDFGSALTTDASGNVYSIGHYQSTADFDPDAGIYNLTSVGSADIYISKLNSSGGFVWAKSIGGSSYDDGFSIAVDGSGNVYTAGRFVGIADFDPGTAAFQLVAAGWGDVFVSKLNSSGNFEWAKGVGGINDDVCKSIISDASGYLYLTGNFSSSSIAFGASTLSSVNSTSEVFIAKLDNSITSLPDLQNGKSFNIYPNPVISEFTISVPGNYIHAEISMTDLSGKKIPITVISTIQGAFQEIHVKLPPDGIAAGIYFVSMRTPEFNATQKLMVAK